MQVRVSPKPVGGIARGAPETTMQVPAREAECREKPLRPLRGQHDAPRRVTALALGPDRRYRALSGPCKLSTAQREQEVGTTLVPGEMFLASKAIAGPGNRLETVGRNLLLAPLADSAGGAVLHRIALGCGILWVLDLICLVLVLAIGTLRGPDEPEDRGPG